MTTDRPAWPLWRILLWASLAVPMCVWQAPHFARALRPKVGSQRGQEKVEIVDFFQEWGAARFYRDGRPVYGELKEAARLYLGCDVVEDARFNRVNAHPPTSVLLLLPLGWLSYPDAALAWNLLSLLAVAAGVGICLRQLDLRFSPWALLPLLTFAWLCFPLWEQVIYGQFNLALLLLLTATWAADRSDRPTWAGVWLGTAAALKLFPGLLFLYFLCRGRWRTLLAGLAVLALWTAITALVLGPGAYSDYVRHVLPHLAIYRDSYPNISIPAFWHKLFDGMAIGWHSEPLWKSPLTARIASALSALIMVTVLIRVTLRARSRPACDHAFGLYLFAMILLSPIAWNHYSLILLAPLLLLWARLPSGPARWAFWACLIPLWINPYVFYIPFMNAYPANLTEVIARPWHSLTVTSYHTYALLIFFSLGVYAARREDRIIPVPEEPLREQPRIPTQRRDAVALS